MSGLAALLAGHQPPTLYQWHAAAPAADVRHTVEHADWRFLHVDSWTVEDKGGFLATVSRALAPDESREPEPAASFDELSDRLGDLSAGDHEGIVVLWDGWSPLARHDERAFQVALSVLGGRAHADRGSRFAVLLRGEGPPLDVPELTERA